MNKAALLLRIFYLCWMLGALGASVQMYRLWWGRERVDYLNRRVLEKRVKIFTRAGLPVESLHNAKVLDETLGLDGVYSVFGSAVQASYAHYLLLPRLPLGKDEDPVLALRETNEPPLYTHGHLGLDFLTLNPSPVGLILSFIVLSGVGMMLTRLQLSFPEGMAAAAFLTTGLVVVSKGLMGNMYPAGALMLLFGFTAWIVLLLKTLRRFRLPRIELPGSFPAWACLGVLLLFTVWGFLMTVVVGPDDWDAWAQWGPKAKILTLAQTELRDVRLFVPGSGDYPLMWPSVWAFSSWCCGGWEEQWGKGWSMIFLVLTTGQFIHLTRSLFPGQARLWYLPAALFISMPVVPLIASWGYAESAFWLMLACAVTRLLRWQQDPSNRNLLLAGLFCAAAAAAKNEGIAFAVLACGWVLLQTWSLKSLLLAASPVLLFTGLWKGYVHIALQTENHVLGGLKDLSYTLDHLPEVLSGAALYIVKNWADPRQWLIGLPLFLLLATVQLFRGSGKDRYNLLLPVGYLALSFTVIVLYGENWSWQLGVVWNRLTVHLLVILLPILLFWIQGSEPLKRLFKENHDTTTS